ncbi:MAG: type II CRISPR-associated endonuclease Cas1 [Gallionella sp.]|nr:type II CRISPR-associated endonuclease Cas1 [Gallionella sp.]
MSEQRVLVIENPAHLRIDTGRLKIEREGFNHAFVSPKDIAVLCLEHHTATLSVAVLRALAEAGAAVIVTDARHMPCAIQIPLAATGLDAGRLRQQITLDASEKRGELWQQLISTKLATQAHALRRLKRNGALRLERLATQVLHGDKSNAEGQGAKHYWINLFPDTFRRSKEGAEDPLNIRLNYGYAVLRSMIARALVASGLNGTLGLGHCNAGNAFNLADDFIEPYRFLVDVHLADDADTWSEAPEFDSRAKRYLLGFVERPVRIAGQDMRLHAAIDTSIASFVRILDGKGKKLVLPEGSTIAEDNEAWASTDGE